MTFPPHDKSIDEQSISAPRSMLTPRRNLSIGGEIFRIVDGDAEALSALYDATVARVHSLALSILRCPQDTEEVVCDVYLFVWHNEVRYDPGRASVMGWLAILTRSRSIDRLRKRRGTVSLDDEHPSALQFPSITDSESPEAALRRLEEGRMVSGVLRQQAVVGRRLITLAFFHGLCHEEIAAQTGLPLGSVKSHIRRTLRRMRTSLEKAESDSKSQSSVGC